MNTEKPGQSNQDVTERDRNNEKTGQHGEQRDQQGHGQNDPQKDRKPGQGGQQGDIDKDRKSA